VTLLLVESLVGEDHSGFNALLENVKQGLNQPWLGSAITQSDVVAVDSEKATELNATYTVAQQIGPILAEGTKGNPRQIKRFLNALLIRKLIAKARGFEDSVNQVALAKLMLAERFQLDFYEFIAGRAMVSENGQLPELAVIEGELHAVAATADESSDNGESSSGEGDTQVRAIEIEGIGKWLERDWIQKWAKIDPILSNLDLRPYVFIARDKRILSMSSDIGDLDVLVEKLSGSTIAVRGAESEVKALQADDARQVFDKLRELVVRNGNFSDQPDGFEGMCIVAKHHTALQTDVVSFISSIDVSSLGFWIVKGWNDILTESDVMSQLQGVVQGWANQDENAMLKKASEQAIHSLTKGSS